MEFTEEAPGGIQQTSVISGTIGKFIRRAKYKEQVGTLHLVNMVCSPNKLGHLLSDHYFTNAFAYLSTPLI